MLEPGNDLFLCFSSADTGTGKHIVNGDIKFKQGSSIDRFAEKGVKFADGVELGADVVVFTTGPSLICHVFSTFLMVLQI